MRYGNLSKRIVNNNYNSNTVVKQDFAVVKQVDGRAARMTDTTRHQSWQSIPPPPPPYQIMLDPSVWITKQIQCLILYLTFSF
jgi:hypothetical protein